VQFTCPHCRQTVDFSGRPPEICQACGGRLIAAGDRQFAETIKHRPAADHEAPTLIGESAATETETTTAAAGMADYRLIRCLGEGGMGAVWEAEQAGTGRRVALKRLSQRLPRTPETIGRFLREARLAASLSHPRTTFVLGAGEESGHPYIVMELMPGRTLADIVRDDGPLPVPRAVDYILEVAEGLQAAHSLGVIHRDLKPSNCFLDSEGRVKVGDFGLSKSLVSDADLTLSGAFLGTPQFAAPEQVRGGKVDQRTDVYATGATLFCLLTGRGPFVGDATAVIAQVASDQAPALRALRPDAPQALERVIARALEKDPAQRFDNVARLEQALVPFSTGGSTIADVGRRLAAYMVDSLIVGVVVTGGVIVVTAAGLIHDPSLIGGAADPTDSAALTAVDRWTKLVTVGLPIAYFALAEGRWGRAVGKRLMGLYVVGPDGDRPNYARTLLRALVVPGALGLITVSQQWMQSHLGTAVDQDTQEIIASLATQAVPILFVLLCLTTMRARNGYRGLHELVSGTRVIRPRRVGTARRHLVPVVAPVAAEGGDRAFGPFQLTGELGRSAGRAVYLARDELLSRPVWIYSGSREDPVASAARRGIARPTRPRWLQGGGSGAERWEAFEAVVGSPIADAVRHGGNVTWDENRHWLLDLAEELAAATGDDTLPESLSLDQVWVARGGRAKLLDAPLTSSTPSHQAGGAAAIPTDAAGAPVERAVALLREATQLCTEQQVLPAHVQQFASELAVRPPARETLPWAAARLREAVRLPTALGWDDRLGVLAVSMGTESWCYVFMAVMVPWLVMQVFHWSAGATAVLVPLLCLAPVAVGAAFKGGPVFWLTKIEVVRNDGRRAGRWRCAWRSLVAWVGFVLPCGLLGLFIAMFVAPAGSSAATDPGALGRHPFLFLVAMCGAGLLGLLFMIGAVWAVFQPRRGLQDQFAGTCLMPR
jgi:uncharacterized RDD family membrane protein YckC